MRDLVIGDVYLNQEIAEIFLCSTQGGMRRSLRTNSLVLISDHTKVYHDRWNNGVLHYTGMGLTGDQDFFYMQNKTLYESNMNGVQVYLFEVLQAKEYTYCGRVELADQPYESRQPDMNGQVRKVCMFPLKVMK